MEKLLTSKIFWTQAISLLAIILAVWGIPLDPATQSIVVTVIVTMATGLTTLFRAFFNNK